MKRRCANCGHQRACHLGIDSEMCMYRKEDNSGLCGCHRFVIQQQTWIATLDPLQGFDGTNRGRSPDDARTVIVREHCLREGDIHGCSWAASVGTSGQIHGVGRTAREARDAALRARVVAWNLVEPPSTVKLPSRKQMQQALEAIDIVVTPLVEAAVRKYGDPYASTVEMPTAPHWAATAALSLVRTALGRASPTPDPPRAMASRALSMILGQADRPEKKVRCDCIQDGAFCTATIAFECACLKCQTEPCRDRFHACLDHQLAASATHRLVQHRDTIWIGVSTVS